MRWAIVIGGVVENIVLWDGSEPWSPEKEAQAVQLAEGQVCGIGWIYGVTTFAEPSE